MGMELREAKQGSAMAVSTLNMMFAQAKRTGKKVICNFGLFKRYGLFTEADMIAEINKCSLVGGKG